MAEERNNLDDPAGDDIRLTSDRTDGDSPAEIKERIEETKSQMGETIDAIQDKLSLQNISEQVSEQVNNAVETAKDALYDATVGKARTIMKDIGEDITNSTAFKTVKNNPLPFILIGVGAGMLAYQGMSQKPRTDMRRYRTGRRLEAGESYRESESGSLSNSVTDTVSKAATGAYDKVAGAVSTAYSGAGDVVHNAYDRVGELGHTARETYDSYIEDNPLALGAVALAMGAAVGMAIPSTSYEGELFGSARQKLMDQAGDTATALIDRTKEVVTEAGQSIADQAGSRSDQSTSRPN
jgi:ElaB/YqjD/DUF883 family membrane-anchored ribosome-binding protein